MLASGAGPLHDKHAAAAVPGAGKPGNGGAAAISRFLSGIPEDAPFLPPADREALRNRSFGEAAMDAIVLTFRCVV